MYESGSKVDIDGTEVTLTARKGFSSNSTRWSWMIPGIVDDVSENSYATPEMAVASARRAISGERCPGCGEPATMSASTARTCANCYDRYSD